MWNATGLSLALGLFFASHQAVTIDLQPKIACPHTAPQMGPGLKRLDPGTVNLPIWVGECPICAKPPVLLKLTPKLRFWIR